MEPRNEERQAQYKVTATGKEQLTLNDLLRGTGAATDESLTVAVKPYQKILPEVAIAYNERARQRSADWDENQRKARLSKFRVLLEVLQNAENENDLLENVNAATKRISTIQDGNLSRINQKMKHLERSVRALELMHKNREGRGKVKLMLVPEGTFADPRKSEQRNKLAKYLLKQFGKWKIKESPLYVTFFGEIEERSVFLDVAKMCNQTRALAVLDMLAQEDVNNVISELNALNLVGVGSHHAHLVVPASPICISGVTENGKKKGKNLPIYSGPAITGRLLGRKEGQDITGLDNGMQGVDNVYTEYDVERVDSKTLADLGAVMMLDKGEIMGVRTTNKSNNDDLANFIKVDIKNTIDKAMVIFGNKTTFTSLGPKERTNFKDKIKNYLNLKKDVGEIEEYKVEVSAPGKTQLDIQIWIKFRDMPEKINFHYMGRPSQITPA